MDTRLYRVMFIDPGQASGYCLAGRFVGPLSSRLTEEARSGNTSGIAHVTPGGVIIFEYGQERDRNEDYHAQELLVRGRRYFREPRGLHGVLFEDFILRRRESDRNLLSPVRITAKVEAMMYVDESLWAVPRLPMQSSADMKRAVTDVRLQAAGCWWKNDPDNHARDATKHALLFWRKFETSPPFRAAILKRWEGSTEED